MKLQAINFNSNINFGYNKKLSAELERNVKNSKDEQVKLIADDILLADEYCKITEEKIIELEGLNLSDVPQNSKAIDFLSEMLMSLKGSLANVVETLFPKMDYANREAISYNNDIESFDYPMSEAEMAESGEPYFWRQEMIDHLENAHDLAQNYHNEKLKEQFNNGDASFTIILPPDTNK